MKCLAVHVCHQFETGRWACTKWHPNVFHCLHAQNVNWVTSDITAWEHRITFEHSYNCHGNHWIGIEGHCHDNTTQNLLGPGKLLNCVKNQLHWRGSTQVVEDIKWAEVNQIPGQRRDMGQPLLQRRKNGSLHFVSKRTLLFLLCCSSGSTMCITLCTVL